MKLPCERKRSLCQKPRALKSPRALKRLFKRTRALKSPKKALKRKNNNNMERVYALKLKNKIDFLILI